MAYDVRVPLLDVATATGELARFFVACTRFRGRVANSARLWAYVPHLAHLQMLSGMLTQREGAGTVVSAKIKELAVLKTSHVNGCAY